MRRAKTDLKKLAATNRRLFELREKLLALRALERNAARVADSIDSKPVRKPARRKFKVRTKPRNLDGAASAKR